MAAERDFRETKVTPREGVAGEMRGNTRRKHPVFEVNSDKETCMNLGKTIKEAAGAGYILLWLLGIPIPVLLLIFLLRGCN